MERGAWCLVPGLVVWWVESSSTAMADGGPGLRAAPESFTISGFQKRWKSSLIAITNWIIAGEVEVGEVPEAIEGCRMSPVRKFPTRESTKRLAAWPRENEMTLKMVMEQRSRIISEDGSRVLN